MKYELKENMGKLEELSFALEEKEKKIRSESDRIEKFSAKLVRKENQLNLESKRVENWDKEVQSAASELEKQKVFIAEEREYLDKQKTDLQGKRN